MKVLVTGATGMIGTALAPFLSRRGHDVVALSRSGRTGTVRWNPARGEVDRAGLSGVDAVVNLAGSNLAAGRWTGARKREIRASRVESTRLLVSVLSQLEPPPGVLISASAIGYYGDTGDHEADESSPAGAGFLAEVCQAWEAEAEKAADFGARVVRLRSGLVLAPRGGPLAKLLPVFKAGLGGRVGSGRQWMSWIAIDDMLGVIAWLLDGGNDGPVNAVAPCPVTNAEFAAELGRVLDRPAAVPAPAAALKLAFGEMAEQTVLASSKVRPGRLLKHGYSFQFAALKEALSHVLTGD